MSVANVSRGSDSSPVEKGLVRDYGVFVTQFGCWDMVYKYTSYTNIVPYNRVSPNTMANTHDYHGEHLMHSDV